MAEQEKNNTPVAAGGKKQSHSFLILVLIFVAIVTAVFITQKEETINWVEDYQAGIELAKQQNKPALLAFYKLNISFCSLMSQNTYNNPDVIEYVEENFIPILIDADKQPDIVRRYKVGYFPTHYLKPPNSDKLVGPQQGYDVPSKFINILEGFLEELNAANH